MVQGEGDAALQGAARLQRGQIHTQADQGLGDDGADAGEDRVRTQQAQGAQTLQQAQQSGIALDTGHYSYSPPKGGGVGRYEIEFPVKAEYPAVREFINRTLTAVPSVGLDKLRIERKVVGDNVVSADVRFVVFVRSESVP